MRNGKGKAGVKKGTVNNPNGRPKGSKNRDIAPIREKFDQLLSAYTVDKMVEDLMQLEPFQRLTIVNGLAEYVIPKHARVEIKGELEINESQTFIISGKQITF